MRILSVVMGVMLLLSAGCGGGSGSLAEHASLASDTYVSLSLETGAFSAVGANRTAVEADPRYKSTHILFRRISAGSSEIGSEGNLSQETLIETVTHGEFFCAVYEVTQDQWTRLAGTTPWTSTIFATAFTDPTQVVAPTLPAWGMSYDQAAEAAAAWTKGGWRIGLPSDQQWEIACRAGTLRKLFSWGSRITDLTLARSHAVFWESGGGTPLPRVVGGERKPNAWGLYDLSGNIGEYATPDSGSTVNVRGGAFDQPLVVCRASNVLPVPRDLGLPTVGVRLIMVHE